MNERSIEIFSPSTPAHFKLRHELLMNSLRSGASPFAIEAEYPLVLSEARTEFSFCLADQKELIAHANFFPREITNQDRSTAFAVALIGNVATDARRRGQGYMQLLIEKLEKQAIEKGLSAVILWSDLYKFYQNLGFSSLGREWRYHFTASDLAKCDKLGEEFFPIEPQTLSDGEIARLLSIRYPAPWTLKRSVAEFRRLLEIPATLVFVGFDGDRIDGYFVIGKGCDMLGVVHEWGAASPQKLISALRLVSHRLGYGEIILLTPGSLANEWQKVLTGVARKREEHAMALAKIFTNDAAETNALAQCFIWGLDSI